MKKITLLLFGIFCYANSISQTSNVIISVDWPNWSSENKIELFDPSGTPILPIIDNGYDGATDNNYTHTENYGSLPNATGYTVKVYDFYGDDWNGNGNMSISIDGISSLQFNGDFDNNVTSGNPVEISKTFTFEVLDPPVS